MNYYKLRNITKLCFGYEEISRVLGLSMGSARVTASRHVKNNTLVRLKRNLYMLRERWERIDRKQAFTLANMIQVPSYISLMTALDYYEVTTQVQIGFVESIAVMRTMAVDVQGHVFNYSKINQRLYHGFSRIDGVFLADPEKAVVDAAYLASLGRYRLDVSAMDFSRLSVDAIRAVAAGFPERTQEMLEQWMP